MAAGLLLCARGKEVAEQEAVTGEAATGRNKMGSGNHGPATGKGVKLAVLGTGIHARGQIGQQRCVKAPPGKALWQPLWVDADDQRVEPAFNHAAREPARVDAPE